MGNLISGSMEEKLKKNQEASQKIMMERQIQMQYQIQKRQMAMQIARNRDMCIWLTTFYVIATFGLYNGFRKTKRASFLAPLVPLTFITLYNWDSAYGNKLHRIKMEAEYIMTHEADSLEWPCGIPTASSLDVNRLGEEEKKRIQPPLP